MSVRAFTALATAAIVGFVALSALIGGGGGASSAQSAIDGDFIAAMVPHHESAIEMAKTARRDAEHPQIRGLAASIITAQSAEISELKATNERLFGEPIGRTAHGSLGLPASAMGMDMRPAMLRGAMPFDRVFIDMMIPHHQGAIRMARIELAQGHDHVLMQLAANIVTAQSREINAMNTWRAAWYGAPSPAGAVPDPNESSAPSMPNSMSH